MQPTDHQPASVRLRLGLVASGVGFAVATYGVTNEVMARTELTRTLSTPIDEAVGFHPELMIFYGGIYALALTPVCLLTDRRVLMRGAAAYALLLLSAVPWWVLWPVTVPRSPVVVDGLFTWGVAFMQHLDPPANCFPSMHVGETVLAARLCWRHDRRTGAVVGALALGVWLSTLGLDQHWFVDGLFGTVLALAADALCFGWRPLPASAFRRGSRWNLGYSGALYLAMFFAFASPYWFGWIDPASLSTTVEGVG